ncbi:MAG TPA: hypothetical protein VMV10_05285 [Pirellulales bacterium]|nr:hypothetical protein [Pirellulales bacterium]
MHGMTSRRLIWVPIIHTQEDLGSLRESVRRLHVRRTGPRQWQRGQKVIETMWTNIGQEIERLDLDYSRVRLYQDGLACCGREEEIVRDLAEVGSRNHQLLLRLMARGARIMGTESPELLLEEYEFSRHAILAAASRTVATPEQREASDRILKRRDAFVARRIDETLLPGETGLAFLGLLHSLDGRLAPDIEVTKLEVAPGAVGKNSGRR